MIRTIMTQLRLKNQIRFGRGDGSSKLASLNTKCHIHLRLIKPTVQGISKNLNTHQQGKELHIFWETWMLWNLYE